MKQGRPSKKHSYSAVYTVGTEADKRNVEGVMLFEGEKWVLFSKEGARVGDHFTIGGLRKQNGIVSLERGTLLNEKVGENVVEPEGIAAQAVA